MRGLTLVIGGTGRTGQLVAARLAERGTPVRVVSRSSPTRFDWYDPTTWASPLHDVEKIYLVAPQVPDLAAAEVAAFVPQALDLGVRQLVLLSGRSARAGSARMLDLERPVRDSGVNWTILRPSIFNQNFSHSPVRQHLLAGEVRRMATGDQPIDFIDVADIAEVAVAALTSEAHAQRVYELSGPRALPYREAIARIAAATGRRIRYVEVPPEQWTEQQLANGTPPEVVEWTLEAADGVRGGFYSTPFDDVQGVLGRPPRAFETFVEEAAAAGTWR